MTIEMLKKLEAKFPVTIEEFKNAGLNILSFHDLSDDNQLRKDAALWAIEEMKSSFYKAIEEAIGESCLLAVLYGSDGISVYEYTERKLALYEKYKSLFQ